MIGMLLSYGLAGLIGFVTGVTVQFGYLKAHGKRIVLPFISNSSRTITMAAIGLALLSLFTIVQVERSDAERTDCQIQFQDALRYNTGLNAEDATLAGRERAAQAEVNDADGDLIFEVAGLVGRTPPATDAESQAPFKRYIERRNVVQAEFEDIERQRAVNLAERRPYPEPNCGQ